MRFVAADAGFFPLPLPFIFFADILPGKQRNWSEHETHAKREQQRNSSGHPKDWLYYAVVMYRVRAENCPSAHRERVFRLPPHQPLSGEGVVWFCRARAMGMDERSFKLQGRVRRLGGGDGALG